MMIVGLVTVLATLIATMEHVGLLRVVDDTNSWVSQMHSLELFNELYQFFLTQRVN